MTAKQTATTAAKNLPTLIVEVVANPGGFTAYTSRDGKKFRAMRNHSTGIFNFKTRKSLNRAVANNFGATNIITFVS